MEANLIIAHFLYSLPCIISKGGNKMIYLLIGLKVHYKMQWVHSHFKPMTSTNKCNWLSMRGLPSPHFYLMNGCITNIPFLSLHCKIACKSVLVTERRLPPPKYFLFYFPLPFLFSLFVLERLDYCNSGGKTPLGPPPPPPDYSCVNQLLFTAVQNFEKLLELFSFV